MTEGDTRREAQGVARRSGLTMLVRGGGAAMTLVSAVVVARTCGAETFGSYRATVAAAYVVCTLAALGLDRALIKFVPRLVAEGRGGHARHLVRVAVGWTAVMALCLLAVGLCFRESIAAALLGSRVLGATIAAGGVLLIPLALTRVLQGVYVATRRPALAATAMQIVSRVVFLCAIGGLALWADRVDSSWVVLCFAAGQCVALGVMLPGATRGLVRDTSRVLPDADGAGHVGTMFAYGSTMLFVAVLQAMLNRTDILMLSALDSPAAAGVYNAGFRISSLAEIASIPFLQMLSAALSARGSRDRIATEAGLCGRAAGTLTLLLVPALAVVALFAAPLMGVYGKEFVAGTPALQILALSRVVLCIGCAAWPALSILGKERLLFFMSAGVLGVNVLMNAVLIPVFGITGAALATLMSRLVFTLVQLVAARRCLGLRVHPVLLPSHGLRLLACGAVAVTCRWFWNGFAGALIAVTLCGVILLPALIQSGVIGRGRRTP